MARGIRVMGFLNLGLLKEGPKWRGVFRRALDTGLLTSGAVVHKTFDTYECCKCHGGMNLRSILLRSFARSLHK